MLPPTSAPMKPIESSGTPWPVSQATAASASRDMSAKSLAVGVARSFFQVNSSPEGLIRLSPCPRRSTAITP